MKTSRLKNKIITQIIVSFVASIFLFGCGNGSDETTGDSETSRNQTTKPNVIVIYTDDQGYADVGLQGIDTDVSTPNIDKLGANGIRFTNGYASAPQCVPSRAAMVTGQYQQRFGLEENAFTPIRRDVKTLGHRFSSLGYATGLVGKWHLGISQASSLWAQEHFPSSQTFDIRGVDDETKLPYLPANLGYKEVYSGVRDRFLTNYNLDGSEKPLSFVLNRDYRLNVVTDAAVTFINRNHQSPFYLHVAHYAPHVPLEAPKEYLSQFSEDIPTRRRYALAMVKAVDDGVGRIVETLRDHSILNNTLIFFISDNGAPIGRNFTDAPINDDLEPWNGSSNTPLVGEKGMLTEGGIRVPFIMHWPEKVTEPQEVNIPVIAMDAAFTGLKAAGSNDLNEIDGIDLVELMNAPQAPEQHRALFWRFMGQKAIRRGKWKYIRVGDQREYLFDLTMEPIEQINLIHEQPDVLMNLKEDYLNWEMALPRQTSPAQSGVIGLYDFYIP